MTDIVESQSPILSNSPIPKFPNAKIKRLLREFSKLQGAKIALVILLVGIPATLYLNQQTQTIKQHADSGTAGGLNSGSSGNNRMTSQGYNGCLGCQAALQDNTSTADLQKNVSSAQLARDAAAQDVNDRVDAHGVPINGNTEEDVKKALDRLHAADAALNTAKENLTKTSVVSSTGNTAKIPSYALVGPPTASSEVAGDTAIVFSSNTYVTGTMYTGNAYQSSGMPSTISYYERKSDTVKVPVTMAGYPGTKYIAKDSYTNPDGSIATKNIEIIVVPAGDKTLVMQGGSASGAELDLYINAVVGNSKFL